MKSRKCANIFKTSLKQWCSLMIYYK